MLLESWRMIIYRWGQLPCLKFKTYCSEVVHGPTKLSLKKWAS